MHSQTVLLIISIPVLGGVPEKLLEEVAVSGRIVIVIWQVVCPEEALLFPSLGTIVSIPPCKDITNQYVLP
jgi:hypothetical protein